MLGHKKCPCGAAWAFAKAAYLQKKHSAEISGALYLCMYAHVNLVIKTENPFIVCVKNCNPT